MTSNLPATKEQVDALNSKVELIKRNFAVGASDDELEIFRYQANRMGLDIIARQIHMVKRKAWDAATRTYIDKMSIQVGIDGYRIIADRTGNYAPGRANTYEYREEKLYSATAYVMKYVRGQWVEVSAIAHYSEYVQMAGKDDNRRPTAMWTDKPHIMLGKCAEALALRRAFPAELSGVYTDEEMMQADNHTAPVDATWTPAPDPEPVPDVPVVEVEKPAEQQVEPTPKMTLETALEITNSKGVKYGELTSGDLSKMTIGIDQALKKDGLTTEARETYEQKLDAIRLILTSRNAK